MEIIDLLGYRKGCPFLLGLSEGFEVVVYLSCVDRIPEVGGSPIVVTEPR